MGRRGVTNERGAFGGGLPAASGKRRILPERFSAKVRASRDGAGLLHSGRVPRELLHPQVHVVDAKLDQVEHRELQKVLLVCARAWSRGEGGLRLLG